MSNEITDAYWGPRIRGIIKAVVADPCDFQQNEAYIQILAIIWQTRLQERRACAEIAEEQGNAAIKQAIDDRTFRASRP